MSIEELIAEGEAIKANIDLRHKMEKQDEYHVWHQKVTRFLNQEVPGDIVIHKFETAVKGFNPSFCSKESFEKVLSVLKAFHALPKLTEDTYTAATQKSMSSIILNNNLTQTQEQHQQQQQDIIVKILLEAAKDELNGKQRKELLAIAEETKDPQEAHKNILAKLKEFGEDVAANIVANIMTSPQVWQNLGSIL